VEPQRSEARLEGGALPPRAVRPHLRRDEDVVAWNPPLRTRPTNLLLVAIHAGGVDVPVAELQGGRNGLPRALPAREPRPEPEQRHADSARDLDAAIGGHARILPSAIERSAVHPRSPKSRRR